MITTAKLDRVVSEVREFLAACDEVKAELRRDYSKACIPGTAKSAACRRASMDLTRALAQFRSSK